MNNLLKTVLFISPVIFLVLYLVLAKQSENKADMQVESSRFEREWNEAQKDFSKSPQDKTKYKARAEEAESEMTGHKKEKDAADAKSKQIDKEVDDALRDFEKSKK